MALSHCLLLIVLTSMVPSCIYGAGFRCKAVAGCEIARCDPSPFSLSHLERNEFPITCVSDGADNKGNSEKEVNDLKAEIERLWNANKLQSDKLDRMENQIEEIRESKEDLENKLISLENILGKCKSGELRYKNICYWIAVKKFRDITFVEAAVMCEARNSTLGYPVDKSHYEIVMREVRKQIVLGLSGIWVRTGIRQDPSTGDLRVIKEGKHQPYVKWRDGQPARRPTFVHLALWVDEDDKSNRNGLADVDPLWRSSAVICIYDIA